MSTVFILTYLSTRSIVHAMPLIVTRRIVVVIGFKFCGYKSHYPDVAQTSLSFFGTDTVPKRFFIIRTNISQVRSKDKGLRIRKKIVLVLCQ